jgi:hypothetical protein
MLLGLPHALRALAHWRPSPGNQNWPSNRTHRYRVLLEFLSNLPSDTEATRILRGCPRSPRTSDRLCVRCVVPVAKEDRLCPRCGKFRWSPESTFTWEEVPDLRGLLNPERAYPVPQEFQESLVGAALYLATQDEMACLGIIDFEEVSASGLVA